MSTLRSYPTSNLGTTLTSIYTAPADKAVVVIGSNIANKLDTTITVDIKFRRGGVDYVILNKVFIPPNTAYVSSGDEQKLVVQAGDQIMMQSDTNNSADVLFSVSEFPNTI